MTFNLIEYIVKTKSLKQKDLAEILKVSRAQISKWKSGEHIPFDREDQLMNIAGLFGSDPEWSIFVKTKENSDSWINYLTFIHDISDDYTRSSRLQDEPNFYAPNILLLFSEIGIKFPQKAPSPEKMEEDEYEFTDFDHLILEYLDCYGPLSEWCDIYLSTDHDKTDEIQSGIPCQMIDYALCFVERDLLKLNEADLDFVQRHNERTNNSLISQIKEMCEIMRNNNIPFLTDYFDLLNLSIGELDDSIWPDPKDLRISKYFSYQNQLLLIELKHTKIMINELHKKIDSLSDKLEKSFRS